MTLRLDDISCGYKNKIILSKFSIKVEKGEILSILGPNGIGKTTLFKTILGFIKPQRGNVFIDDKNINKFTDKQKANLLGYVPQSHIPPFPFKALDVVLMGRTPKLGMFENPGIKDIKISKDTMKKVGILDLEDRIYTELSGGERQLVLIARALAQEAKILILDEPTSNLDFGNQVLIIELVNKLALDGLSIVMTTHHPEHVFQTKSKVALILKDKTIICGQYDEVLTRENLLKTYGIDVDILSIKLSNNQIISSCFPIIKNQSGEIHEKLNSCSIT